jgi:hypothetical protein
MPFSTLRTVTFDFVDDKQKSTFQSPARLPTPAEYFSSEGAEIDAEQA